MKKLLIASLIGLTLSGCTDNSSNHPPQPKPHFVLKGRHRVIDTSCSFLPWGTILDFDKNTKDGYEIIVTNLDDFNSFLIDDFTQIEFKPLSKGYMTFNMLGFCSGITQPWNY